MNFDERQIVNSVSQVLREKENLIQNLQNQIKDLKVENTFKLMGKRENPYPYMKIADYLNATQNVIPPLIYLN